MIFIFFISRGCLIFSSGADSVKTKVPQNFGNGRRRISCLRHRTLLPVARRLTPGVTVTFSCTNTTFNCFRWQQVCSHSNWPWAVVLHAIQFQRACVCLSNPITGPPPATRAFCQHAAPCRVMRESCSSHFVSYTRDNPRTMCRERDSARVQELVPCLFPPASFWCTRFAGASFWCTGLSGAEHLLSDHSLGRGDTINTRTWPQTPESI